MPSQTLAAWPPPETPAWMCDLHSVQQVLIRRRVGDTCVISLKRGIRVYDKVTRKLERHWSLTEQAAPLCNLFATEEAARAVWHSRKLPRAA